MEKEVQQLVDMGATPAQARAALKQYKDVMEAAEQIFDGRFDHVKDDEPAAEPPTRKRPATPDDDDDAEMASDDEAEDDDDDDVADFMDYDSDLDNGGPTAQNETNADPYAGMAFRALLGIFFSKDRREEVVEVEEDAEIILIPELNERVKLMTQGEWMKGCPERGEQVHLFSLYSQLSDGEAACPNGCGTKFRRQKKDFFAIYPSFNTYVQQLQKAVRRTCNKCHSDFCLVCGESFSAERASRLGATMSSDPLFHCADIQGGVLGVGLFMLEQLFYNQNEKEIAEDDEERKTKRRKTENVVNTITDGIVTVIPHVGIGVGKSAKGGTGYAGELKEDNTGQLEAQANQRAKDEKLASHLTATRVYLPNLHRTGGGQASDYLVHPTTLAHLRRRFNHVCSSLLRNDSLADMSDRTNLYFELLHWLEASTISNHEALASMMAMPIMVVHSIKPNQPSKSNNTRTVRERTVIYEGSPGPRELLEVITIQAQAALKGLEGAKPREIAAEELTEEQKRMTVPTSKGKEKQATKELLDDNQKLTDFCRRITTTANAIDRSLRDTKGDAFVDRLQSSLPKLSTSSAHAIVFNAGASDADIEKQYVDWATHARFEYCDLTMPPSDGKTPDEEDYSPSFKFFYSNEARMLANSDIPRRSLAIAKEVNGRHIFSTETGTHIHPNDQLAVLTTNLPVAWASSVFLRVDETRIDVIKVLITGPEGTPYENGCYLFDVFLGPSYNQSPPSVKYITTNGGKYRFNPNLYADGKVCLSLLGTWQGPGWVSGKSTLLQVLISIQSMILCDEPYLNEPGWANSGGTPQSRAYSANVRRMVVKTAMLGNLRNPPDPWGDVIRTHFRLKARAITAQLDRWLEQDDGKETLPDGGGYAQSGVHGGSSNQDFRNDVESLKAELRGLELEGKSSP